MRIRAALLGLSVLAAVGVAAPSEVEGQIVKKLKKAAKNAAENETQAQIDRLIRNAIRCLIDDPICYEEAEASGEEVIFVDDDGEIITDEEGVPITDREAAAGKAAPAKPGEGAWANYDFVPGDEILFYDDYSNDRVGDFPRRLDLVQGNWEIVEWQGARYFRATSNGTVAIPLPGALPDRFTVEFPVNLQHGNARVALTTGPAFHAPSHDYRGSSVSVWLGRAGLRPVGGEGPESFGRFDADRVREGIAPVRVMADGEYMKIYVGEERVANAPNAVFPRSDRLFLSVSWAREDHPILIGPIRVAAGGRDLYDRLAREGRVTTRGILFATNSDRIRPESTPTLEEIGRMLEEHPDLRLRIEGHTDSDGEEAYNRELSERRAAAVERYLVERRGVDEARLETAGLGESQPVADNSTPEGKQHNRRVELVMLESES